MSKIIVPLHFAKLTTTPGNVEVGFKKFYLKGEWFKLFNGASEIDVVLDRPLDNYIPIPGTITASDSVLTAIEKLDYAIGNINPNVLWGSITGNILAQTDLIAYIASVSGGTLQQIVNAGNSISNFGGIGTADILSVNFTNNRSLYLNNSSSPTIKIVDNLNASHYTIIDIDTINLNGVSYNWSSIVSPPATPTLQQVTTAGAITTDTITVGGIISGNFYSDGYSFGLSDNYDANYNFLYQPYIGLQITDTINYVYLYQDASIGFQTAAGSGNLRSDLLTGIRTWQFPDASGIIALTTDLNSYVPYIGATGNVNIGVNSFIANDGVYNTEMSPSYFGVQNAATTTFGLLEYNQLSLVSPTSSMAMTAAGITFPNASVQVTAFPPTGGTISQYIRGDGTLATFPTITIPTLQQVTTAGNTSTNAISITNPGLSPYFSVLALSFANFNNITTGKITKISVDDDFTFQNGANILYLKSPVTISGTNTQTLQNATGTIALLSDIPAAGVTSVGLTMPSAFSVTNSPITSSGNIAVTGAGLVSQYVRGDGTLANFPNSTGGGSSVNYYLNGSVSQGTFGGDTYYEMSKTPILGAGTNFIRTNGAGNGYIASFITDAGDPSFLNIPGGNWNVEFYFQSSASGGSPQFYAEIYKVSATNVFTLVASGSANPEGITNGTTVDQYFTSISVPQTSLLITDRLAVRIYVITGGRTITLHTENGNLCEVLTTFTTGLTALNGLTDQVQFFNVGTSGTDFAISSAIDTHTFDLPTASATNRGALSSTDWSTFNAKPNLGLVQAMTQGLQNIF